MASITQNPAILAWCAVGLGLLACGRVSVHVPRRVASGSTGACPVGAVDTRGPDGHLAPVDARCAYDDAIGEGVTRLGGSVHFDGEDGMPGAAVGGVEVTVHRVAEPLDLARLPAASATATTDRQGSFHLSAILPAGRYVVVVWAPGRVPVTHSILVLEPAVQRRIEDLRLRVPRPGDPPA